MSEYIHKGHTIKIEQDEDPESPRSWDNLGTMVCKHNRYTIGDEEASKKIPWSDFNSMQEVEEYICKNYDVAIILPVYLYDHSGLTINTTGFSCRWDSGQVGFIFIEKSKVKSEYSVKRISKQLKERVAGYLIGEVKTYSQYLEGDVYGYTITDHKGEMVESVWGFYGYDETKKEAESAVPETNAELYFTSFKLLERTTIQKCTTGIQGK